MNKTNWILLVIAGGFYYYGEEIEGEEGYITIKNASMFGGFGGGKGLPGVQRQDPSATVTLDRFEADSLLSFPMSAVYGIINCEKDLYKFKGTTLR